MAKKLTREMALGQPGPNVFDLRGAHFKRTRTQQMNVALLPMPTVQAMGALHG